MESVERWQVGAWLWSGKICPEMGWHSHRSKKIPDRLQCESPVNQGAGSPVSGHYQGFKRKLQGFGSGLLWIYGKRAGEMTSLADWKQFRELAGGWRRRTSPRCPSTSPTWTSLRCMWPSTRWRRMPRISALLSQGLSWYAIYWAIIRIRRNAL